MYSINVFGFIALVPIFFIAYSVNSKKMAVYGIVSGFLFYCLYLFWMNAYLAVVGVGFVTIVYGGYFVIALLLVNLAARAFPAHRALITPFIWIGIEYIRSFGFLGFTFGSIGYTQHNFVKFIQVADIGGEPLVSFIVVLFNAGIAHILVQLFYKPFLPAASMSTSSIQTASGTLLSGVPKKPVINMILPLTLSLCLIIFSLIYGSVRTREQIPENPKMKLTLIQALSSPRTSWEEDKLKTLFRLLDMSRKSFKKNPDTDLIVWTETAIRTSLRPNLIYGTPYHMKVQRLIKRLDTFFVIGSPDNYSIRNEEQVDPDKLTSIYPGKGEEEVWTNSAYFLNRDGEIISKYDKMQLTPFGEHFPLGKKVRFLQKILDKFTDSAGFTKGTEHTVFEHEKLNFSVVICWEGTYGYMIRKFILNGADFIINISNDMWTETDAGHFQHFSITKFRAVENRVWFARAANDGVTAIINPHGEVVKIIPIKETGYLTGSVGPKIRDTFYTKHGDILPKVSVAVLVISFVFSIYILIKRRERAD
jgi:apolipoprotein N-acyltransferase